MLVEDDDWKILYLRGMSQKQDWCHSLIKMSSCSLVKKIKFLKFYIWLKLFWQNRAETYRNVQVFWFDKRYKAWTRTIRLMTIIFSIAKEMWFSYVNRTSNRTHYIFLFIIMLISLLSVCLRLSCSLYLMRKCWFGCWWFLCNLSWLQDYEVILDISLNLLII